MFSSQSSLFKLLLIRKMFSIS